MTTGNDKTNEWYTPPDLIALVRELFGGTIDLDAASCPRAQAVVQADTYYTIQDNGLAGPWYGNTYNNPPHDRTIGQWVAKALAECLEGVNVILLIPVSTGTQWWEPLWDWPIVWLGRVPFWRNDPDETRRRRHGKHWPGGGDDTSKGTSKGTLKKSSPRVDYSLHLLGDIGGCWHRPTVTRILDSSAYKGRHVSWGRSSD